MGKKKAFIDKKNAKTFKLVPGTHVPDEQEGSSFKPTKEHLDEQHKYGIYFDDDYDYMQHLKDVKDGYTLQPVNKSGEDEEEEIEERFVIRAPAFPFPFSSSSQKVNFFEQDFEKALEGDFGEVEGDLDDNFIELAGGALPDGVSMMYRAPRKDIIDSDEDEDSEDFDENYIEEYGLEDEEMEEDDEVAPSRKGMGREFDDNFEKFLETDYTEDQVGELDGDDEQIGGAIEPDNDRLKRMAGEAPKMPEYDEQIAKDYVRKRMALIEAGVIKETEQEIFVEVDESCAKRMKWDCESFASQYTNIYNHPTIIKDTKGRLSRKALKKLERESVKTSIAEDEDEEMEEGSDDEVSTVSTFRPKGETPEQRKLRKQAVKEARRVRRVEKKANKVAFGEEFRKAIKSRVGQVNGKPLA